MHRRILVGFQCLFLFLSASVTLAIDFEWDGGAGNDLWNGLITEPNLDTNWSENIFPSSADDIILTGASLAGPQTIDLNGPREINRISANGVAGTYTFENTGTGALTLFQGAGEAVITRDNGSFVFENDLLLNSPTSPRLNVQSTGGKITVNGDIASSANPGDTTVLMPTVVNSALTVGVEIAGVVSDGTGQISISSGFDGNTLHVGTVRLTGQNTYTGSTRVNIGTLEFTSIADIGGGPNALGQPAAVDSTIRLGTAAAGASTAALRYLGTGHSSNRVIELAGKNNDNSTIDSSGSGPLVLSGGITNPTNSEFLNLDGANLDDNAISGSIDGGAGAAVTSLRKRGVGKWILSGDSPTLDGTLNIEGGELVVTGSLGTNSANTGRLQIEAAGTLSINGGFMNILDLNSFAGGGFNFGFGEMRIAAGTLQGGSGSFTIGTSGAGTLQLDGGSGTFDEVTLEGTDDSLHINGGTTYLFSNLDNSAGGTITATAATVEINGGGAFTHRVDSGTSSFGSRIEGAGGFTKQGAGTLEFTSNGQHAYSGPTRVEEGTLRLVGSNGISTASPVFVAAGATLDLVGATGGDAFGPLTGNGTITTADSMGVEIFTNGQNADFGGAISGAGRLAKTGLGKQTLSGANTYTGPTEINNNGGTLEIAAGGSIVGTVDVSLSGAELTVSGGTIDTPGNIRPVSNSAVFNIAGGLVKANAIDRTVNSQYLHQFNWTGGTVHLLTATTINGSTLTAINRPFDGPLTLNGDMALIIDDILSVTGLGTLNISDGAVTADDIIGGGDFNFISGALRMRNDQTFDAVRLEQLDLGSPLTASKTLTVDGVATIDAPLVVAGGAFHAGSIVNPDNLILASGTLTVTDGDFQIADGEIVDVTSGMTVNAANGALNVASGGQLNAINAEFDFSDGINNSGDINLINSTVSGDLINGAAGSLALLGSNSFNDDFDLSSTSSLFIDIAGTQTGEFDTLAVGGDASLAGELIVALDNDFSLTVGDSFEIIVVDGTQNGMFGGLADEALLGSFGGVDLFIDYDGGDGNDVVLFTLASSDVDLDSDGDVDGSDFLAVQLSNPALIPAWQNQYGSDSPVGSANATVPEPTSGLLLLAGACLLSFTPPRYTVRRGTAARTPI